MQELQEIKHTLELQSSRGQDALDILELELKATQAKNSELQSTVIMLENKLKESEHIKQKVSICICYALCEFAFFFVKGNCHY